MTGYTLVNLRELIEQLGEDKTKIILSNFICPQNKDVDDFLKFKSIEFSKQGIAITYLVFAPGTQGDGSFVLQLPLIRCRILIRGEKMPRTTREKSSTGIYHVLLRGVNHQIILEDDEARS